MSGPVVPIVARRPTRSSSSVTSRSKPDLMVHSRLRPPYWAGSSYRVAIRQAGFVPYVSDWVRLDGERADDPPIRLLPLQRLSGRVQTSRAARCARGRVFVPGGGPESATDADGTFSLSGVSPGKTVVLAEHAGFWLQGWLVDPSANARSVRSSCARTTEGLGPTVKPPTNPIPPEESRALADRLLAHTCPRKPRRPTKRRS